MQDIYTDLQRDEGLRLKPYRCTAGKLTIGYGRNLEDCGISEDEATKLLHNDITRCIEELTKIGLLKDHHIVRQDVLINMCFNLGLNRLLKFKKMLAAWNEKDYETAANEMIDSAWHDQVGERAKRLVFMMRYGKREAQ